MMFSQHRQTFSPQVVLPIYTDWLKKSGDKPVVIFPEINVSLMNEKYPSQIWNMEHLKHDYNSADKKNDIKNSRFDPKYDMMSHD